MSDKKSKSSHAAQETGPRGGITKPSKAHGPHSEASNGKAASYPQSTPEATTAEKRITKQPAVVTRISRRRLQQGSSTAVSSAICRRSRKSTTNKRPGVPTPMPGFEFRHQWCGSRRNRPVKWRLLLGGPRQIYNQPTMRVLVGGLLVVIPGVLLPQSTQDFHSRYGEPDRERFAASACDGSMEVRIHELPLNKNVVLFGEDHGKRK